ncbi:MAG: hypothetical protein WC889_08850 [Myxococcota bacterium]|jgi:ATP-dependent DNA helicase RecG
MERVDLKILARNCDPPVNVSIERVFPNAEVQDKAGDQSAPITPQVPGKYPASTRQVTPQEKLVLTAASKPSSRIELQRAARLKDREHFVESYIKPLMVAGLLEMTLSEKPHSSKQRYRITELGQKVLKKSLEKK